MEALVERCCGLDVHRDTVVACVLVGEASGRPEKLSRSFSTMTESLVELREWLVQLGCTQVGMESTGSYWRPVYEVLEEAAELELIVGNAQHIKNVPGRKTDMKDAEWIAKLVRHGLVRKSFVPPREQRELRDLVRYRKGLVRSRTDERNRLIKMLETANVKLASVASDVFGLSGMKMLRAIANGEDKPEALADLSQGLLRKKLALLRQALAGRVREHHRFMLKRQLARLDSVDADISAIEAEIQGRLQPHAELRERLHEVPGIKTQISAALLAEVGTTLETFPTEHHLCAWGSVAPGNNESAGKNLGAHVRRGNLILLTILVEAAQTAVRKKGSYLRDKFHRLKARRGYMRALIAIARKILIAVFHIIKNGKRYRDLGDAYLDNIDRRRTTSSLVRRLQRLGYNVQLSSPQP